MRIEFIVKLNCIVKAFLKRKGNEEMINKRVRPKKI